MGCCVYEMTTLEHAFNAKDMNSLVLKIIRGQVRLENLRESVSNLSLAGILDATNIEKIQ